MATVDEQLRHTHRELRSSPGPGRHHGGGPLAEVIMIRSGRAHRPGLFGSLVTKARVFVSPRVQAASVRSNPPHPPSSPAPRSVTPPPAPNDAA